MLLTNVDSKKYWAGNQPTKDDWEPQTIIN